HVDALLTLDQLATQLRNQRFAKGSIDFDTEEVKFVLDENGKPLSVKKKIRLNAHRLIEDFMLLANQRVAMFVHSQTLNQNFPFVYRIHDTPDPEKLQTLKQFVRYFGHDLDVGESTSAIKRALAQLLLQVQGKAEESIVRQVSIRSMAKAIYSTRNIGHFGLGFPYYTHFTSPIRRYPDVLAHRLLQRVLENQGGVDGNWLEKQCKHSSDREKLATEAERASIKYKQVEFLSEMIGKTFYGIISSVSERGFYVELEENKCEGMVRTRDLLDDYYVFDEQNFCIRGRYYGRVYRLGNRVKVRVLSTDLVKRYIDFDIVN
ncbi:MAG: RNB domain-containing ribonuclease, partial [Bacteroidia bacterium]|nr:RNB domain-containing ribonuclease [Bacteroidia bacterium]